MKTKAFTKSLGQPKKTNTKATDNKHSKTKTLLPVADHN